jgi:hypothetical protein
MAYSTKDLPGQVFLKALHELVGSVGARWRGVQEALPPELPLLIFENPETGHTLQVQFDPFDCSQIEVMTAIKIKLEEDTGQLEKQTVSVRVAVLQSLSKRLVDLSNDIDTLWRKPR